MSQKQIKTIYLLRKSAFARETPQKMKSRMQNKNSLCCLIFCYIFDLLAYRTQK